MSKENGYIDRAEYMASGGSKGRTGKVCGAERKLIPGKCMRRPCPNGRCPLHGGHSLAAVAHPNYKHGRQSKYLKHLPQQMQNTFAEMLADPDLHSMNESLALLKTRLMELCGQLGKSGPPYEKLLGLMGAYWSCKTESGKATVLRKFEEALVAGQDQALHSERIHREIRAVIAQQSSALFTESKARRDLGSMIELDKVMAFGRAVFDAIQANCVDPLPPAKELCRAIMKDVLKLMPPPSVETNGPPTEEERNGALLEPPKPSP